LLESAVICIIGALKLSHGFGMRKNLGGTQSRP